MRKEILHDGNSHKIRLTKEDLKLYELAAGDVVDISEMVKIKNISKLANKEKSK